MITFLTVVICLCLALCTWCYKASGNCASKVGYRVGFEIGFGLILICLFILFFIGVFGGEAIKTN